jgi:hypothetical protein
LKRVRCQQRKAKSRRKTAFLFSNISALTLNSAHRIAIDPGNAILQTLPKINPIGVLCHIAQMKGSYQVLLSPQRLNNRIFIYDEAACFRAFKMHQNA